VRPTRNLWWIAERTGGSYSLNARAIEAVRGEQITGMVAYDSWTHNSAQISIALDDPHAWFALRKHVFAYPFDELGLGVLIALVSSANKRSLRLTEGAGFKRTHEIKDAILPGTHLVVFEKRPA